MSLRILYVGNDLALYRFLEEALDIKVVRCVGLSDAKLLIKGIEYSAIVLDESAKELERFIRRTRKKIPIIVAQGSPETAADNVRRSLPTF